MPFGACAARAGRLLLGLMVLLAVLVSGGSASAQVQQGATLTVLRGQVAVVRADGTAVQPAPNGVTVNVGDEIRTISKSSALITFFSGTEIEMGEDTILVVDQLSRNGDQIERLAAAGARLDDQPGAVDRWDRRQLPDPAVAPSLWCAARPSPCLARSRHRLATSWSSPAWTTARLPARFRAVPWRRTWDTALPPARERLTRSVSATPSGIRKGCSTRPARRSRRSSSTSRATRRTRRPARIPSGQRQENAARSDSREQKDDAKEQDQRATPTPTPPSGGGISPCNTQNTSGGAGVTTNTHSLGATSGTFTFTYDALAIPDRFQIVYEGQTLLDTGFVSGASTRDIAFSGSSTTVTVTVTGSSPGTAWSYTVGCAR